MTATISAQDALAAVHEAAQLGGDTGWAEPSIAAATGLDAKSLRAALTLHAMRGTMSRLPDGRWIAWAICPTCGYGADDRYANEDHPRSGVCETHPADYCAGYPLTTEGDLA